MSEALLSRTGTCVLENGTVYIKGWPGNRKPVALQNAARHTVVEAALWAETDARLNSQRLFGSVCVVNVEAPRTKVMAIPAVIGAPRLRPFCFFVSAQLTPRQHQRPRSLPVAYPEYRCYALGGR